MYKHARAHTSPHRYLQRSMMQDREDPVSAKTHGALAWDAVDDDGDEEGEHYSRSIAKGRRKKRRRVAHGVVLSSTASATPSFSEGSSTLGATATEEREEEEEIANCLMLLARGHGHAVVVPAGRESNPRGVGSRAAGEGNYYECKTCGKRFSSFQALGGHRTSHTKLRNTAAVAEEKAEAEAEAEEERVVVMQFSISPPNPPVAAKARAHECVICGMEFSSGQALGGHMRRHRPVAAGGTAAAEDEEEGRREDGVLDLDLNLPAPSTDDDAVPFVLSPETRPIPALVDCHY